MVRFEVPGAEESEINVSLEDQTLTVEASSKVEKKQKKDDHAICSERRMGRFRRQITLPKPVDAASMKTNYEDGVLTVTVKKTA